MRKLTLFSGLILIFFSSTISAQNVKTLYEKTKETLRIQVFSDLGLSSSLINTSVNAGEFFDNIIQKIQTERGRAIITKYQQDLKKAEGLKTEVDYNAERRPTNEEIVMISPVNEVPKQPIDKDDNNVYSFVSMSTPPSYPGGMDIFYKLLYDNIKYPEEAKKEYIQGSVFVSFIIEKNGALTNIKIDRALGYGTDEEAIRVLKLSKRWNPGIHNGRPVRVRYNIPVKFKL